jgi:prefoldin subunit 5
MPDCPQDGPIHIQLPERPAGAQSRPALQQGHRHSRRYGVDVNTTIFITTVVGLVTTNLGAVYFMANRLGASIDSLGPRIDRLDGRIDVLQGAVADIGARLTALERRF